MKILLDIKINKTAMIKTNLSKNKMQLSFGQV